MSRQKQDKIWDEFVRWCIKRKLRVLPAHPWTISAYMRWLDGSGQGDNAEQSLKSISRAHILRAQRSPHDHPVVLRTMLSIKRRQDAAPDHSNLFQDKDFVSKASHNPVDLDEVGDDQGEEGSEDRPSSQVQMIRRGFAMRSKPKLVQRRNLKTTRNEPEIP
jgi:hypothetical protein